MNDYIFRGEDLTDLIEHRTVEINHCIVCSAENFECFSRSKNFPAEKCRECGFIWMRPMFSEVGLNKYYSNYIGKRRINNEKKMAQRQRQYKIDVDFIEKYQSKGVMLDIGCSGGFFLDCFNKNIEKHGIDVDQNAVNFANKNFNELAGKITCTNLQEYNPTSRFDLITMRGVIEHVISPEEEIKKISSLLKKDGMFAVSATPNSEAISVDLYRENWTLFHPIQHLWHFSPKTLEILCNKYNLELIASDFPYLGTPYENVHDDIKQVSDRIKNEQNNARDFSISPAFFGNMMSLIFRKYS